jgi:hypothetical protein
VEYAIKITITAVERTNIIEPGERKLNVNEGLYRKKN